MSNPSLSNPIPSNPIPSTPIADAVAPPTGEFALPIPAGDENSPLRSYDTALRGARETRLEHDSLGDLPVPVDAYWGIHTARALVNFPITRRAIYNYPDLIRAIVRVKQAAARANLAIGVLDPVRADAIDRACDEIVRGALHGEFRVGVVQGGAGTSTNMNANEVIANRALELLGRRKGEYAHLHPIDDVNRSQSTNDVYPTAIKLAMIFGLQRLLDEHEALAAAFSAKGEEFATVLKIGRTQLQDAVPMTVGQEFRGWAHTLREDEARLREVMVGLREISLGATAIGTGITADPAYAEAVRAELSSLVGMDFVTSPDLIEATSDTGVFMSLSGTLKRSAVKLSKICNDLRLLSSGPQAGLRELVLPPRQAGSSIMPGKVNPVIPEVVNQVAFMVIGADATVTAAAEAGQLQLNAFEPIIAHSLLQSVAWLANGCFTLRVNCVEGIEVDAERLAAEVGASVGVVTALTPFIGYQPAAEVAKAALAGGRQVADLVVERGLMSREDVVRALTPERLSGLAPQTTSIPIIRERPQA